MRSWKQKLGLTRKAGQPQFVFLERSRPLGIESLNPYSIPDHCRGLSAIGSLTRLSAIVTIEQSYGNK